MAKKPTTRCKNNKCNYDGGKKDGSRTVNGCKEEFTEYYCSKCGNPSGHRVTKRTKI